MTEDQKEIICRAQDNPSPLTAWEIDWLDNISDYPDHCTLSHRQEAVLNRIERKLDKDGT